jgi:hypothetical protein
VNHKPIYIIFWCSQHSYRDWYNLAFHAASNAQTGRHAPASLPRRWRDSSRQLCILYCLTTQNITNCKVNLFRRLIKVVIKRTGKRSVWPRLYTADFLSDEGLWYPFPGLVPDPICMLWRREKIFSAGNRTPNSPMDPPPSVGLCRLHGETANISVPRKKADWRTKCPCLCNWHSRAFITIWSDTVMNWFNPFRRV